MGTLNYTVTTFGKKGGNRGSGNTIGTSERASGAFTTSTSAADITSLTVQADEIFRATASEDMWIRFGGNTAAVGTGFFLASGATLDFEVTAAGAVSTIDVS